MKIIYLFLIVTLIFIIYIEYSVGSILFRPNSNGKISMNINSLLGFLINPFYKKDLWNLETLDINYAFILLYSYLIYYLF
jgi:hypothetical protein